MSIQDTGRVTNPHVLYRGDAFSWEDGSEEDPDDDSEDDDGGYSKCYTTYSLTDVVTDSDSEENDPTPFRESESVLEIRQS